MRCLRCSWSYTHEHLKLRFSVFLCPWLLKGLVMAEINRASFFKKLNSVGYKCFEAATVAAKTAGNPYIEITHLINQALTLQDSDIQHIMNAFGVNPARMASDLQTAMAKLPR